MTNMELIGHNKRFWWAEVGALGSTHDSRLLRSCGIYSEIEAGHVLSNRSLNLDPHGGQSPREIDPHGISLMGGFRLPLWVIQYSPITPGF